MNYVIVDHETARVYRDSEMKAMADAFISEARQTGNATIRVCQELAVMAIRAAVRYSRGVPVTIQFPDGNTLPINPDGRLESWDLMDLHLPSEHERALSKLLTPLPAGW